MLNGLAETIRRQLPRRQPHAGTCNLDAAGDLGLIAAEGDGNDRDAVGERLLGDAHAGVADDAGRSLEQGCVREEALDPNIGRRSQARGIDLCGRDDDVERLADERSRGNLGEPAVVLEKRRAGDEHELPLQLVEPGGWLGLRLPESGADEPELARPVGAGVFERLGCVGDHDGSRQVDVVNRMDQGKPELGAKRVDVLGDHPLERSQCERLHKPVAEAAEAVAARCQPKSERRCVARGQRHRRDDRERPRQSRVLGCGRRSPGALVDQQNVRPLGLDRLLEVTKLEGSALAELAKPGAERAKAGSCLPVVRHEPLDLRAQGVRVEAERA